MPQVLPQPNCEKPTFVSPQPKWRVHLEDYEPRTKSMQGLLAVGLGPVERVGKAPIVLHSLADIRWQDLHSQIANENAELVEAVV